ncbi:MAG: Wzz/FepE/Etk N-terminal domain-containing protein [Candidatus Paceibacterota bacterium]
MELKSYLKIVNKERKMISAFAVITALSAFIFSIYTPEKYEASVSLFLNKAGTQSTDEFKYDGYYALESGEIVTNNIEKILQSPQVVDEIYKKSETDLEFKDIESYKKKFTVHKMSNLYVEVSFESKDKENAENIARAITETINQKMEDTSKKSEAEIAFAVENTEPIIVEVRPNATQNGLIGLLSGALLGILAAFLKRYFA